jgi:hypothetical protein
MYRIWDKVKKNYEQTYRIMLDSQDGMYIEGYGDLHEEDMKNLIIEQCTGLKDKNGVLIYEGAKIRFANRWQWYRGTLKQAGTGYFDKKGVELTSPAFASKEDVESDLENYPYEERVVKLPEDYEWLLSNEIQEYWEVSGNIMEDNNE